MKNKGNQGFEDGERAYKAGDYKKALLCFMKAAEQGDHRALKRLGDMYSCGRGVEEDYGKALDYYKEADAKGNPEADYYYNQIIHILELML